MGRIAPPQLKVNWILMVGYGWLYDALPKQAVWRPRLAVDSYCLAD